MLIVVVALAAATTASAQPLPMQASIAVDLSTAATASIALPAAEIVGFAAPVCSVQGPTWASAGADGESVRIDKSSFEPGWVRIELGRRDAGRRNCAMPTILRAWIGHGGWAAATESAATVLPESGMVEVRASSVNNELACGLLAEGQAGFVAWHVDGYRRTADDVDVPGFAESAARRAEEAEEAAEHGEEAPEEIEGTIPNTSLVADGGAFGLTLLGRAGHIGFSFNGHNTVYGVPAGAH